MTTNSYLQDDAADQNLIEDLIIESIQNAGRDVKYIQRSSVDEDYLFNEDPANIFNDADIIEMYLNDVDGFGGDGAFLGKFGFQIKKTATFSVSKKRFTQVTGLLHPREGDLVYFPLNKSMLEVKFVEHEDPFYQAGKQYVYLLKCELFEYSHEEFTTNDDEIDSIIANLSLEGDADQSVFADNLDIEQEADASITFDPSNPFGEQ